MSVDNFRILAAAAMADGSLGETERPVLLSAARDFGIADYEVEEIIHELSGSENAKAVIPTDSAERARVFRALIDLIAADGKIDKGEEALFMRVAPQFGLHELEAEDLLRAATQKRI